MRTGFARYSARWPRGACVWAGLVAALPAAYATGARASAPTPLFDPAWRDFAFPVLLAALATLVAVSIALGMRLDEARRRLAAAQRRSRQLASHDPLLALPNRIRFRTALDEAFASAVRDSRRHGLLYLDLDRFKDINDSHGHDIGDRLLIAFARRVRALLNPKDVFARIGGDEFAILRHDVSDADALLVFAKDLVRAVDRPFNLESHTVSTSVSVGAALGPDGLATRVDWAQRADFALYRAKQLGRNRVCMFEAPMFDNFRRRRIVRRDLPDAIRDGAIEAHYQPIFDAEGQRIVGAEALLRWTHPELGAIPADLAVSVAEESGLILPLGEWMLRRACRDAMRWKGLRVAVNVSPVQFKSRGFVDDVARVLKETGLPGERLELELTEGVIVSDADQAEEAMTELRTLGVRMALDDFGSGYSRLMYLRRFPFEKIKIDRSFVESVEAAGESAVLLSTVIKLGHALGLSVTAEGVETPEQLWLARSFGCEEVQGYLLARPTARDEFEAKLKAANPGAAVLPDKAVA